MRRTERSVRRDITTNLPTAIHRDVRLVSEALRQYDVEKHFGEDGSHGTTVTWRRREHNLLTKSLSLVTQRLWRTDSAGKSAVNNQRAESNDYHHVRCIGELTFGYGSNGMSR